MSEPTITVLANAQNFTATVDMTLSASPGKPPSYSLNLVIKPTTPPAQPVKLLVWFGGFPPKTSGNVTSLPSQHAYYATGSLPSGPSAAVSQGQQFVFTSSNPIGQATRGPQLRVAFPNLVGEQPGSQYSYAACSSASAVSIQPSYAAICADLPNLPALGPPATWYTPALEADRTTLSSDNPALTNYQVLAGDNPTLLGGNKWTWIGINGVTMLADNVPAQDNQQNDVFYSGVLLGVAAGALIAFVNELLRPVWRKGRDEPAVNQSGVNQSGS